MPSKQNHEKDGESLAILESTHQTHFMVVLHSQNHFKSLLNPKIKLIITTKLIRICHLEAVHFSQKWFKLQAELHQWAEMPLNYNIRVLLALVISRAILVKVQKLKTLLINWVNLKLTKAKWGRQTKCWTINSINHKWTKIKWWALRKSFL